MPQSVGTLERARIWKMGRKQVRGRKLDEKASGPSGTGNLRPRQIQRRGSYLLQNACFAAGRGLGSQAGQCLRDEEEPKVQVFTGRTFPGKEIGNRCGT